MGTLPATGTRISMGGVAVAYGLEPAYPPAGGSNIGLNSTLGAEIGISLSTETKLSEDFGGLTTPNEYLVPE